VGPRFVHKRIAESKRTRRLPSHDSGESIKDREVTNTGVESSPLQWLFSSRKRTDSSPGGGKKVKKKTISLGVVGTKS